MVDHCYPDELDEAQELLHFAFRKVTEWPDQHLAAHGLTRVHHRILYFVGRYPGCSVGDLLAILGVSKQALNGPLRRLQREGWIVAPPHPDHLRRKQLLLTDRGAALLEQLSGNQRDRFAQVFAAVGPHAAAVWRDVMHRLAEGDSATERLRQRAAP